MLLPKPTILMSRLLLGISMLLSRVFLRDIDVIVESLSQGYRCYCRESLLRDIDVIVESPS